MTMENDIFNSSVPISDQNSMLIDATSEKIYPDPLVQHGELDLNSQTQIISGYPLLSTFPSDHIDSHIRRDALGTCAIGDNQFPQEFVGPSMSATSLATLLSSRTGLQETAYAMPTSETQLANLRTFISYDSSNASKSNTDFVATKQDMGMNSQLSYRWDYHQILGHQELPLKAPNSSVGTSYHVGTNHSFSYRIPSNELSLSLASSRPSIVVSDQCSEISCSGVTQVTSKENGYADYGESQVGSRNGWPDMSNNGLGFEQTTSNHKDLLMGCGPYRQASWFLQVPFLAKYLHVAQDILIKIASNALENLKHMDQNEMEMCDSMSGSNMCLFSSGEMKYHDQMKLRWQKQGLQTQKAELLAMLQVVDRRYSQCVDQIQAVVSAFHVAMKLDPKSHTQFTLHMISSFYRKLRDRISHQIIIIENCLDSESMQEKSHESLESSVQKQLMLQHMRRSEPLSWRPQRGLPEKSVTVLRQWMFQNFLHPYPKDTEKHLLALQSGLTRNQVSNWFINARVRLWKPMIEEMYLEMNKTDGKEEGNVGPHRHPGFSNDHRFQME